MMYRINFTIPHTNFNLAAYDPRIFIRAIPKKNGEQLFKEWYLEYENGITTAFIKTGVIENVVTHIRDKIIKELSWAKKLHEEAEDLNKKYFVFSRKIFNMNLSEVDNRILYELYRDLREWQVKSHAHAISTTWFLDSDGEVFSAYLREQLETFLIRQGITSKTIHVNYFTILTTPDRDSFATEEQIEFLELLQKIQQGSNIVHDYREDIITHYKKWHWLPYGYIGPAYTLDYYVSKVVQGINTINVNESITTEKNRSLKFKKEREELEEELQLPRNIKDLFAVARDIIWLKDYRKYCIWHGHYVLDMITKEISRRMHISHKQANHMLTTEVEKALLQNKIDESLLNKRIEYTLIHSTEDEIEMYYGERARSIRAGFEIKEIELDRELGFKGACACPGEVKGKVKIVNSVKDVDKVQEGDIMLSLTTYPSMLPAMKRAGAIVTEDGGITCHAAIVSREFKIPCIVGVKKICSILQDDQDVQVDATNGIIKKI